MSTPANRRYVNQMEDGAMSHLKPENEGGLGQLVHARLEIERGLETLREAYRKVNGASQDDYLEIERLTREVEAAELRGYEQRDEDGQRLYQCLALFDKRDGSPLADIVQAAREGWERSHGDMAEDDAWDDFERLIGYWNAASPDTREAWKRQTQGHEAS